MTSAPINELTNMYAGLMGAGKPNGNTKGENDNAFQDLMNQVAEGVDVVKELTPTAKQDVKSNSTAVDSTAHEQGETTATKDTVKNNETAGADNKERITDNKSEKADGDTLAEKTVEKSSADAEEQEVPEEVAAEVVASVMAAIAQQLDVPVEDIAEAMETLGLQEADLLDTEALKNIAVFVKADGDPSALLTDEELLLTVKDLQNAITDLVEEETDKLDITPEMLKDALSDKKAFAIPDEVVENETNPGVVVETANNTGAGAALSDITEHKDADIADNLSEINNNGSQMASVSVEKNEGAKDGASLKDSRKEDSDKQETPLFAQNAVNTYEQVETVKENVEELNHSMLSDNAREILNQVRDQIRVQVTDGLTELQMKLNPENLGNVHLSLTAREGAVTAQFTAENDSVRQALEMQIAQLKESIEQQGVKVEAVEVTVSSHAFEQNMQQGNEQNLAEEQEKEALRKATRKINLFDENGEAALEELSEEEAVTVDMMKADGNSMDYKA